MGTTRSQTIIKSPVPIEQLIHRIRNERVILDADLARIYGVPTKQRNQQVKRNLERFPADFMFRLTGEEADGVIRSRSQFVTLKNEEKMDRSQIVTGSDTNRSHFATGSQKHRDPRFTPYAFSEHGVNMAATVLNSSRAVEMSVYVTRICANANDARHAKGNCVTTSGA